jgi:anti-sigma B factor antagonist
VSVKTNIRQLGDVTLIDVSGRITIGEGSSALRQAVLESIAGGAKKIVLNLGGVSWMDSSGIGEIFSAYTSIASHAGSLKLLNLSRRVTELLQITRMYRLFDVHEDESHALSSFA